jgi:cephalosporin hydroxylase
VDVTDRIRRYQPHVGRFVGPRLRERYRRWLVDEFATYYYNLGPWQRTTWLGVPLKQAPGDIVVFQQIVWDTRPTLVVETGTFFGGSALFWAHLFDHLGEGKVVSVDIDHSPVHESVRRHPRIELVTGDSTAEEIQALVRQRAQGERAMLYLDADHNKRAVVAELRSFADLVSPGCYAVVADSIMGGHPAPWPYPGQRYLGPYEAVEEFLQERDDFRVDESREYHLITFNPHGYLLRNGGAAR